MTEITSAAHALAAPTDKRPALLAAILAANPCHGADWVRAGAEHWPRDVTLAWLLRTPRRGERVVSAADRAWLARKLLPRDRVDAATRVIVLRAARVHAAGALERRGFSEHAEVLRGITDGESYAIIRRKCLDAYAASAAYAAYAAESEQQALDYADAAEGWAP